MPFIVPMFCIGVSLSTYLHKNLSLTTIHLGQCSNVTVSGNRVMGPVEFFISAQSAIGLRSLHVNDNVAENCRKNAIRIDGALLGSAILDNRFAGGGKAIECSTMESTTVRPIGEK